MKKSKKYVKRIMSVLLVCIMVFSLFSVCASAEGGYIYIAPGNATNDILNAKVNECTNKDDIEILMISGNPQISDISYAVRLLPNLKKIYANNCSISDISWLSDFGFFVDQADDNDPNDLPPVQAHIINQLIELELEGNGIYDITPLGDIPYAISKLSLDNNYITNITPLYKELNISSNVNAYYSHLSLENNFISDARLFEAFKFYSPESTYCLHLNGNYISNVSQISKLEANIYDFGTQNCIPENEAERFVIGEISKDENEEPTYGIKGYFGGISDSDIIIPTTGIVTSHDSNSSTQQVNITAIDGRAFRDNVVIETVSMGDNITDIGEEAFYSCTKLKRIKLSNNITDIKKFTFFNCVDLAGVCIPNSVTNIEDRAFRNCANLKAVEFSNKDTTIATTAFRMCNIDIFEVFVSSSISDTDFGLSNIVSDTNSALKNSLLKIYVETGTNFFNYGNPIRRDFNIVNGLLSATTYSGDILKIPVGVTNINVVTYNVPITLKSVIIPEGVTNINLPLNVGSRDFKVLLPNSTEAIGTFITSTQPSNVDVYYNASNTVISNYVTTNDFIGINDFLISYDVLDSYAGTSVANTEITIPSDLGIDEIGAYAFYKPRNAVVQNISKIVLPNGIRIIGSCAFMSCSSLTEFIFGTDNKLKTIGSNVFRNCTSLTAISIPNSVVTIYARSFLNCTSLVTFDINENASLKNIGVNLFEGCTSLRNTGDDPDFFVIPENVTKVPSHVFMNCHGLANLQLPEHMTTVNDFNISALEGVLHNERDEDFIIYCNDTGVPFDLAFELSSAGYNVEDLDNLSLLNNLANCSISRYSSISTIETENTTNSDVDLLISDYLNNKNQEDIDIEDIDYLINIVLICNA